MPSSTIPPILTFISLLTYIRRLLSYLALALAFSENMFCDLSSFSYMSNCIGDMLVLTIISILSGSLFARSPLLRRSKKGRKILCRVEISSRFFEFCSASGGCSADLESPPPSLKVNHWLKSSSEEKIWGMIWFSKAQSSKRLF